jgi:hypothetical protein
MLGKKTNTDPVAQQTINDFDAEVKALEENLKSFKSVSAAATSGLSTGSASSTSIPISNPPQWGQGYASNSVNTPNYQWNTSDPMLEKRVKDLEEQMAKLIRAGIDKMEINNIGDLQHFLETLVMKLDDLIMNNPDVDNAYDCDNIKFLLKELEDEIEKWTEAS